MRRCPSRREFEAPIEVGFTLVSGVAGVIALHCANSWMHSHPQFVIEDLILVTVLAMVGAIVAAPVVIMVAAGAIVLLLGGLLLLCAFLFIPLAFVWLAVRRLPRVFYESVRAVCVTAINVLLYPRCRFCGHHHLHAITRRPSLVADGRGHCPVTR
jgi:hypothetical protein